MRLLDKRATYEISRGNGNNTETWSANLHMTKARLPVQTRAQKRLKMWAKPIGNAKPYLLARNTIATPRTSPREGRTCGDGRRREAYRKSQFPADVFSLSHSEWRCPNTALASTVGCHRPITLQIDPLLIVLDLESLRKANTFGDQE